MDSHLQPASDSRASIEETISSSEPVTDGIATSRSRRTDAVPAGAITAPAAIGSVENACVDHRLESCTEY